MTLIELSAEEILQIMNTPADELTERQELYCMQVAIEYDKKTRCSKCGSKKLKISYPITTQERIIFCFDCKFRTHQN